MSSLFTLNALLFAAECLIGSALVLGAAQLVARGRSAGFRHLVWVTAFGLLLALPLLAAAVPPQVLIRPAAAAPLAVLPDAAMPVSAVPAPPPIFTAGHIAEVLFVLWLAGVLWVALRGAIGGLRLCALHRRSVPYFLEHADTAKIAAAGGRRWKLRLSTMPGAAGPMAWGIFRPVVLLPKDAVRWPRERLEAVLLHELAHVRRHDCLAQLVSLAACALYWPNPLAWLGARTLRREAEIAADDAVLVSGVKPSAYAGLLLDIAAEFRGARMAFAGLSMAAPSALEARVESVLAPTQSRTGVTAMDALKLAGLGLMAASLMVLARPSFAQADEPPAPIAEVAPLAAPDAAPLPQDFDVAVTTDTNAAPPPAPPAPLAPPAPAAMPAPVAPTAMPAPPAPPATVETEMHIVTTDDSGKVKVTQHKMPDTAKIMAEVRPQIEQAMKQAKEAQIQVRVMMDRDKVDAQVAEALSKAQPEIDRALAEAGTAMAQAKEAMKHVKVRVEIVRKEKEEEKIAPAAE